MKKISIWASVNKWPARIIITVSYFVFNTIALFLGDALAIDDVIIPSSWIYLLGFIAVVGFIFYPSKKNKSDYDNFYRSQKTCDLLLISTGFLLIIAFGNHFHLPKNQSPFSFTYAGAASISVEKNSTVVKVIEPARKKKGSLIKQWKQKLKENIRRIRQEYKDASPGEKTALIIVTILVALLLLYLVAALSCNISCSGNDAAAVIVLLLGTGLLVFLTVRVIKRINRGRPKKPKTEKDSNT
jgi:predicted membrane channel-forming protein YqfA (hemolysin III family)